MNPILSDLAILCGLAVADPGFSWGGGAPFSNYVLFCKLFAQKLHENENNWTPGARPWCLL